MSNFKKHIKLVKRHSAVSEYLYLLNMLALKVLAGVAQSQDAFPPIVGRFDAKISKPP